jgi:peptide/nickel transport system substrate-binding protein
MRTDLRTWVLAAAAAAAAYGLPAASWAQGKTLRVAVTEELPSIDPIYETSDVTRNFGFMVFDQLFAMDANFQPQPMMIDTYNVSEDRLTYEMKLRSGLKWHDGTPVTSKDAVQSIKRWMTTDQAGKAIAKLLKSIETTDDLTFRIALKEPYGLLIESFGKFGAKPLYIMPARLAATPATEPVKEVVGSGPFKFVAKEWVPGSKVVFEKNPDYVPRSEPPSNFAGAKVVNVDRVEWVSIPDEQSKANALLQNEVHIVETPAADLLPILNQSPDVKVEIFDQIGDAGLLRLNWLHPPFNDVRARRAMHWIVNQADILQAIVGSEKSLGLVCGAVMLCKTPFENQTGAEALLSNEPAAARYEKAKALLKEAGYKGEKLILLEPSDNFALHSAATVLAAAMRKAGMNVDMVGMDSGSIQTRQNNKAAPDKGGWNVTVRSGGIGNQYPAFSRNSATNCGDAWYGWPCDAETQAILDKWPQLASFEEQKKAGDQLQIRAMDVVPWIPFGQWRTPVAYRKEVTGIVPARRTLVFWNLKINGS